MVEMTADFAPLPTERRTNVFDQGATLAEVSAWVARTTRNAHSSQVWLTPDGDVWRS